MFQRNKTQTARMEDVLSNTELARVLNSLTYEVANRGTAAVEIAKMSQLQNQSILIARLLKGVSGFGSNFRLGEYDYMIDTKRIERKSPRIKFPKKKRWLNLNRN